MNNIDKYSVETPKSFIEWFIDNDTKIDIVELYKNLTK
jgi:hypothetical protein